MTSLCSLLVKLLILLYFSFVSCYHIIFVKYRYSNSTSLSSPESLNPEGSPMGGARSINYGDYNYQGYLAPFKNIFVIFDS